MSTKTKPPGKRLQNKAQKALKEFLDPWGDTIGDAKVYSHDVWKNERGEKYGRDSLCTLVTDGSFLYEMFNYCTHPETMKKFEAILKKYNLWYELGYAWSVHIYDNDQ